MLPTASSPSSTAALDHVNAGAVHPVLVGPTSWPHEANPRSTAAPSPSPQPPPLHQHTLLHLVFDGFGAKEASSDAFVDNHGSNAISRGLGYEPNGSDWATRQGEPALLNRWRLTRDNWEQRRRDDVRLHNIEACLTSLPLS
jgi:hypothetical protein